MVKGFLSGFANDRIFRNDEPDWELLLSRLPNSCENSDFLGSLTPSFVGMSCSGFDVEVDDEFHLYEPPTPRA